MALHVSPRVKHQINSNINSSALKIALKLSRLQVLSESGLCGALLCDSRSVIRLKRYSIVSVGDFGAKGHRKRCRHLHILEYDGP